MEGFMNMKKIINKRNVGYAAVFVLLIIIIIRGNACVLRKITGLPCPSCGMTRSFYALFRGDIKTAFYYHPLFWSVPPIFVLVIFWRKLRYKKLIFVTVLAAFFAVYIIRMIMYFPHTPPMDYNSNSIFAKIYYILINVKG